ncbi:hypothetical protein [Brucella pituitosa]|uniref:hypothetical protein n=1 Tax=Brucella pituitosa TaxID=571256 RepID=UPI003F4ADFD3
MTIPDEAVQAMPERIYAKAHGASTDVISGQRGLIGGWNEHKRDGQTEFVRADLAAPFLQGVKVKALEWTKGVVDIAHPHPGMKYVACSTTPKGSWAWWLDNAPETRDVFSSEEAAKAAAQSAYEARILSALEPFANSYPQGANLAAHSKNENGPDHEPSPRAQALEEGDNLCSRLEGLASWLDGSQHSKWCGRKEVPIHGYSGEGKLVRAAIAAIRALSSQPIADWWLPIETAPKDGTEFIGWDGKWPFRCSAGKKYELYPHMDGGPTYRDVWDGHYYDSLTIEHPTHWRPLPASPEVSG